MTNRAAFSTFGFRHSFVIRHSCFVILPHSSFVLRHLSDGNPPFHGRSRAFRRSAFPRDRRVRRRTPGSPSRHLHFCAACPFCRWNAGCFHVRSTSYQRLAVRESSSSLYFNAACDRAHSCSWLLPSPYTSFIVIFGT